MKFPKMFSGMKFPKMLFEHGFYYTFEVPAGRCE